MKIKRTMVYTYYEIAIVGHYQHHIILWYDCEEPLWLGECDEIEDWLSEFIGVEGVDWWGPKNNPSFYFTQVEDAMAFKLGWS